MYDDASITITSAPKKPRSNRISSVEFWRFFFTFFVCIYHLDLFFPSITKLIPAGSSAVEFFFILAGFTMAMSARRRTSKLTERMSTREAHALAIDFVRKKLKATYPILIGVLIFGFIIYPLLGVQSMGAMPGVKPNILRTLMNTEWELLFLVGTPFGVNSTTLGPMWFLTALMLVGYVYTYAINKNYEFTTFAAPAIGILGYIFFTLNSNMMIDHSVKMGLFNAGTVHAISEMSFGVGVYCIYDHVSKKEFGKLGIILLSLLEAYAIYRFFALTIHQPISLDNFRKIPYIMMIIFFSFLNKTYISRFLNQPFWRAFGHISLAMYLAHVHLIQVYMQGLMWVKGQLYMNMYSSSSAGSWLLFLSGTGGYNDSFQPIPLGWKDATLYVLLVMLVACLIMAGGYGVRKGYAALKVKLAPPPQPTAVEGE
ncbi:MAG: hypothetical protein LBN30_02800 [Oscillospiraceae bacterium]|jgi:peptidoglycan/LPS O-acetylase OafA/YrhL|nr:hypothetical protein [Oscillospiraceae bacterium]